MSTEAEIKANQANAQHSTGPRTEAGKAISSRNATTHGLTAATVLLPGEDPVVYQCFTDGMLDTFKPVNTAELALVLELINVQWRLRRGSRFEAKILSAESIDTKALNNLGIHTARLKRQYSASLKEFQQMHRDNWERRIAQLQKAETIHRADQILNRPSTIAFHGFDFTPEYFERWIQRKEAFTEAKMAITNSLFTAQKE